MNRRVFKIGTIVSFKDFDEDKHDTIALVLSKQERRDGYLGNSYLLHLIHNSDEFWVKDINLNYEIDIGEWRIEYEPEEKV
jgi:hypothetical protein